MKFCFFAACFFYLLSVEFSYSQDSGDLSSNNENVEWEKLDLSYKIEEIVVLEDSIVYNSSRHFPALRVNIPEVDKEHVRAEWIKVIKGKSKSQAVDENDIISMLSTVVEGVSHGSINVYSVLTQKEIGADLVASFEVDGGFLSPAIRPDQYENARHFLKDFAAKQYKKGVEIQVVKAEKSYKEQARDLKKLQNQNQKLHTKVKTNEMDIVNRQDEIQQNDLIQKANREQLMSKKKSMSGLSGELLKEKKKEYRELEREKQKIYESTKRMSKKIISSKSVIEASKQQIVINLAEQDIQKKRLRELLIRFKSLEAKRNILAK